MNHASINLDAKKSAYEVLDAVWRGRGFPVDPNVIATELGITVTETELPDNILGGLVKDKGKDPVILINQNESDEQKRFNCAQKIGHYMVMMLDDAEFYKYVELRVQPTAQFEMEEEIFANYFGASLLMPDLAVRQLARKGMSLKSLARHFGVTIDAMEYRLRQLGIDLQLIVAA